MPTTNVSAPVRVRNGAWGIMGDMGTQRMTENEQVEKKNWIPEYQRTLNQASPG